MLFVNARLLKQYGQKIKEGTVICKEGDAGSNMYIIYSGKVRISKNIDGEDKTLVVLGDGDFFGEMALILKEPRTATATTMKESVILIIDEIGFDTMLRKSPDVAIRTIKTLADRLKNTNKMLGMLSNLSPDIRVCAYLLDLAEHSTTKVEEGMQIVVNETEIISRLSIYEKQYVTAMEGLKRANICYKLRLNFFVVTDVDKLKKYILFLKQREIAANPPRKLVNAEV